MRIENRHTSILMALLIGAVCSVAQEDAAVKKLPRINLTSSEDVIMPGGMSMGQNGLMTSHGPTIIRKHYFYLEGFEEKKRVNYLASNLAPYLKPVPGAYKTIKTYQVCRVATPLMMAAGIATIIGSLSYSLSHSTKNERDEYNPPKLTGIFIGIGIAACSWIPYLASKGMVERAVALYNEDPRARKR